MDRTERLIVKVAVISLLAWPALRSAYFLMFEIR